VTEDKALQGKTLLPSWLSHLWQNFTAILITSPWQNFTAILIISPLTKLYCHLDYLPFFLYQIKHLSHPRCYLLFTWSVTCTFFCYLVFIMTIYSWNTTHLIINNNQTVVYQQSASSLALGTDPSQIWSYTKYGSIVPTCIIYRYACNTKQFEIHNKKHTKNYRYLLEK